MTICENCGNEHDGNFGSGRFCSRSCANSRGKRTDEFKDKVRKSLGVTKKRRPNRYCPQCGVWYTPWGKLMKTCSVECSNKSRADKSSIYMKKHCSVKENRERLRDIGRKGGFGKKGVTKNGTRYESTIEKKCFEYLESLELEFEAHKQIPNSSKVSDVFIPSLNLWVEIDGIDREKKQEWIGKDYDYWIEKMEIYKNQNLNVVVVKSLEEFMLVDGLVT